jgi:membrane protein implicated in regulation of membrane protease activity
MPAFLPWLVFWIIIAAALYIGEMLTGTFFILPFAIGATISAIASVFGADLLIQVIIFIVVSIVALVATRPLAHRLQAGAPKQKTNADRLVGMIGTITEQRPGHGEGRVKVEGDLWNARAVNGEALEVGELVRVIRLDSTRLIVEKVAERSS